MCTTFAAFLRGCSLPSTLILLKWCYGLHPVERRGTWVLGYINTTGDLATLLAIRENQDGA